MDEKKYFYEIRTERLAFDGIFYETQTIYLTVNGETSLFQQDVARQPEEANRICELLNRHDLEPEQAKYVVEDCIIESYFV